MCVYAGDACPAQMVGNPLWLNKFRQLFKRIQISLVEWIRSANRQGNSMHYDRPDRCKMFQDVTRIAEIIHEVLADDFKPIHVWIVSHQVREMLISQPNAQAKLGQTQALVISVCHRVAPNSTLR